MQVLLVIRMSERAEVWLKSQRTLGITYNEGTDDFKKAFTKILKPFDDPLKATEAVMDLKQKDGESYKLKVKSC